MPEHGWVRVELVHNATEICFESSAVPNNPISELISAVELALHGRNASIWWNLEPAGYYFNFIIENSELILDVRYSSTSNEPEAQSVLNLRGNPQEILIHFWRALRKFESFSYEKYHWPFIEFGSLRSIEIELKRLKAG